MTFPVPQPGIVAYDATVTDSELDIEAMLATYSGGASAYRDVWAPVLLRFARGLVDRMSLAGAGRILEIGCGPGLLLPALADAAPAAQIVGGDRTGDMLALAPASFDRVICDAMSMPFPSATFDAVLMPFMLFHVPSDTAAIAEVARILRPSGAIGLAVWGGRRDPRAFEVWGECFPPPPATIPPRSDHTRMDTPDKVRRLMERGSLTVQDIWVEPLAHVWSPDGFIRLQLEVFPDEPLGTGGAINADQLHAVRERLRALPAEDMTDNCEVIRAIATAPGP